MLHKTPLLPALMICALMMGCSDKKEEQQGASPSPNPEHKNASQGDPHKNRNQASKEKAHQGPPPMSPVDAYARKMRPGNMKRKLTGTGPDAEPNPAPQETTQECQERIKIRYEACVRDAKEDDLKLATCEKFRIWFKGRCGNGPASDKLSPPSQGTPHQGSDTSLESHS